MTATSGLPDRINSSDLAPARHLVAVPALEYEQCPRWCGGHCDRGGVRVHTGPAEIVVGSAVVTLSVETHDDGRGNVRELFWLGVDGVDVELSPGRTHDLMQALDRVFWKLDRRGAPIGSDSARFEFADKVKRRLAAAGASQADLAREAHISPAMLSLVLRGQRGCSESVASAIETALGTLSAQPHAPHVAPSAVRTVPASARSSVHNRGGRA
ncbi:helix-turn-helix domain-containing protein [Actinoplanes sp. CA-142083]|uniref:helix-turn-helix domain-containing protein n=1 Tax=Actinoplanes sp. CA-142083 TaxID=3239903 RepID=UPI003D8B8018